MKQVESNQVNFTNFEGDINHVTLRGWIDAPIRVNHQTEGSVIYSTKIRIERKAGIVDIIPLHIKDSKLVFLGMRPKVGDYMEIHGYFHSKDIYAKDEKKKMETYVYVDKMCFVNTMLPSMNEVHLTGKLYRTRVARTTQNSDRVIGFLLKVKRNRTHKYSRIPCTVWGTYKVSQIEMAIVGAEIELKGRLQSHEYIKNENGVEISKTVYEISVTDFEIKDV